MASDLALESIPSWRDSSAENGSPARQSAARSRTIAIGRIIANRISRLCRREQCEQFAIALGTENRAVGFRQDREAGRGDVLLDAADDYIQMLGGQNAFDESRRIGFVMRLDKG